MSLTTVQNGMLTTDPTNASNLSSGTVPYARQPTGSVLQVVTTSTTTVTGTTSGTYTNTTLTLSITPKFSTSKVLVLVSGTLQAQADNRTAGALGITRNGTLIFDDQRAIDNGVNANVAMATRSNITYLDSPASTSAQTYYVQVARSVTAGTSYAVNFPTSSSVATITLMEIAG